jgi:hypothetical protein
MKFFSSQGEEHLESIVYFLSESLRAAIEAGDRLQQSVCNAPQFTPGMEACEIADRLASFRHQTGELWGLEAMMLTKILRAGELARELRGYEPAMRPEIDTFRLATIIAGDLRDMLMPDAETAFNGAVQPKRFLEARGHADFDGTAVNDPVSGYRIGGEVDVRLLMDACEALHFCLARRYGIETAPLMLSVEADDRDPALEAEGNPDEPFLLSEWGEIVSDDMPAPQQSWRPAGSGAQAVRH